MTFNLNKNAPEFVPSWLKNTQRIQYSRSFLLQFQSTCTQLPENFITIPRNEILISKSTPTTLSSPNRNKKRKKYGKQLFLEELPSGYIQLENELIIPITSIPSSFSPPTSTIFDDSVYFTFINIDRESGQNANIYQFLRVASPQFPNKQDNDIHFSDNREEKKEKEKEKQKQNNIKLIDIWEYFDRPFGHEVPVILNGEPDRFHLVPYLSAMRLFPSNPNKQEEQEEQEEEEEQEGQQQQEEEGQEEQKPKIKSKSIKNKNNPIFEFYEWENPTCRSPFFEKIEQLSEKYPFLLSATIGDIDRELSWFSVSWCPILCYRRTLSFLQGSFLTYHSFFLDCHPYNHILDDQQQNKNKKNSENEKISFHQNGCEQPDCCAFSTLSFSFNVLSEYFNEHEIFCLRLIGLVPMQVSGNVWFQSQSTCYKMKLTTKNIENNKNNKSDSKFSSNPIELPLNLILPVVLFLKSQNAFHSHYDLMQTRRLLTPKNPLFYLLFAHEFD